MKCIDHHNPYMIIYLADWLPHVTTYNPSEWLPLLYGHVSWQIGDYHNRWAGNYQPAGIQWWHKGFWTLHKKKKWRPHRKICKQVPRASETFFCIIIVSSICFFQRYFFGKPVFRSPVNWGDLDDFFRDIIDWESNDCTSEVD